MVIMDHMMVKTKCKSMNRKCLLISPTLLHHLPQPLIQLLTLVLGKIHPMRNSKAPVTTVEDTITMTSPLPVKKTGMNFSMEKNHPYHICGKTYKRSQQLSTHTMLSERGYIACKPPADDTDALEELTSVDEGSMEEQESNKRSEKKPKDEHEVRRHSMEAHLI